MSAVAILPARGGSRRIPRKNIALFHGRPMISYPIVAAKESGLFESIIVTTDDPVIGFEASRYGAEHVSRPEALALDEIGTQEVARWVLKDCCAPNHYEYACVIYPCTPMMMSADLRDAYYKMVRTHAPPHFYFIPGWFYWGKVQSFLADESLSHGELPAPSERWIDINVPSDWETAEKMYRTLHPEVA